MFSTLSTGSFSVVTAVLAALVAVNRPAPVVSQGSTPEANLTIIPENTDQARQGDSVTLVCQVSAVEPRFIEFEKRNITNGIITLVDENGPTPFAGDRLSLHPLELVDTTGPIYSQKVTITSVQQVDEGTYRCIVVTGSGNLFVSSAAETLNVYPAEAFPVCTPDGQAAVMNGSTLSCRSPTEANSTLVTSPDMPLEGLRWKSSGAGSELTKTVTAKDNGSVFTCLAITHLPPAVTSCKIGPLMVLTASKESSGGLTAADIAGIVVGAIVLVIIIALHFLCCTPRRWTRTKSYLFDIGSSSFGTSNRRRNDQPSSAELGVSQPEVSEAPPRRSGEVEKTKTAGKSSDQLAPDEEHEETKTSH